MGRCFSGYVGMLDYDKCELYSLEDFQQMYGNGVIKCDAAVPMSNDITKIFDEYGDPIRSSIRRPCCR